MYVFPRPSRGKLPKIKPKATRDASVEDRNNEFYKVIN